MRIAAKLRMHGNDLTFFVNNWREWAKSANKTEDGWQSEFPEWRMLITAALDKMKCDQLSDQEFENIELVWSISEEDEDMADQVKKDLEKYWAAIVRLAKSSNPEVRWQIYDVLSYGGERAEPLLSAGLADEHAYPRRRAILGLIRLKPHNAFTIRNRFLNDPDPCIRQIATELLQN